MPWDDHALTAFVRQYERPLFALALHLAGGDQDAAYRATADGFVEALRDHPALWEARQPLVPLARAIIARSRQMNRPLSPSRPASLVASALQTLPFEARIPLLLRDTLHRRYEEIAAILGVPVEEARAQTRQARLRWRARLKELLGA